MGAELIQTPQELWKFGTTERAARRTPILLFAPVENGAAQTLISTFRRSGLTVGYEVTAAKTLIITRIIGFNRTALNYMNFRYTDNDLGQDAVGPGTNPVYLDATGDGAIGTLLIAVVNTFYDFSVYFEIPTGKFFSVENTTASSGLRLLAFGHEE